MGLIALIDGVISEERIVVAASVVSALAALGALKFARDTVRETAALRREDRLARLAELVVEFGEFAINAGQPTPRYEVRRARVAAMLAPLDDPLPACRVVAYGEDFANATELGERTIGTVTVVALDELAELLASRRRSSAC